MDLNGQEIVCNVPKVSFLRRSGSEDGEHKSPPAKRPRVHSDADMVSLTQTSKLGQRSVHIGKSGVSADARFAREWKDFLPPILWFVYQDASFHENVKSHEYVQLLGQSSTHSLQGSDLYQRADVETLLRDSECNVRLSSDEPKHYNVCRPGEKQITYPLLH